jgi:hypothetical protein
VETPGSLPGKGDQDQQEGAQRQARRRPFGYGCIVCLSAATHRRPPKTSLEVRSVSFEFLAVSCVEVDCRAILKHHIGVEKRRTSRHIWRRFPRAALARNQQKEWTLTVELPCLFLASSHPNHLPLGCRQPGTAHTGMILVGAL